ncbi:type IV secretory system conjugative DNA transfer family protein [Salegentibacter sp. HM20]
MLALILIFSFCYLFGFLSFAYLSRLYPNGELLGVFIVGVLCYFLSHIIGFSALAFLLGPLPLLSLNLIGVLLLDTSPDSNKKYRINFKLASGKLTIENLRRGVSITGAAGSGKTESVVYSFLTHLRKENFCGVIHDYKDFELTELAYPLYKNSEIPFYIISFDPVFHRVNPIAPVYLQDEEGVNEIARVLLENLLEQKEIQSGGSTKFFNDAVEGILCGMIWKLKSFHPEFCSLPHLIALYQIMDSKQLVAFLSSDLTSKAMADAFISGIDSERQTAAVKATLANALKKITTRKIFYCLSGQDVPLDLNNPKNPGVIAIVNNPKFETAYSPIIATILHSIIKQMSVRHRKSSFILMEEAPTIRLINMHRIPATLRSFDITTLYVMQDRVQNDLLYGEKASKAILSNLSYQFFGKVNDPTTASYYERFFELVQRDVVSISKGGNLNFDTRITKTKREVSKLRADLFFRLKPGEFVAFADGKEKRIRFPLFGLKKELPEKFNHPGRNEIETNYLKIFQEAQQIAKRY